MPGGPIWIPKVYDGRNKSFFYFTYVKIIQPVSFQINSGETVPTALMKQGNFTEVGLTSLTVGVGDAVHRTPDLPLFTFYCPATQQTIQTSDRGRALITGKCADVGKFKVPSLRALATRAPYFHNGSAA